MNLGIGNEATQFHFREYIKGIIFGSVYSGNNRHIKKKLPSQILKTTVMLAI
jgi:hypothetical protein